MTKPATLAASVAAEIRAELGRRKVSQAALARALSVSDMYVSRRLSDGEGLSLADVEAIADFLAIPVTALFAPAAAPAA